MGDAEDIIFNRQRVEKATREQQERREVAELSNKIVALMPKAIDNLRRHDYVFASQCHEVVTFNGEERIGWSAHCGTYGDNPCGHEIYVLGDGSIVSHIRQGGREVDLRNLALNCIQDIWRTVWAMSEHKKR